MKTGLSTKGLLAGLSACMAFSTVPIAAPPTGPQVFMHGGWNNYDLRGVGWTSYAQVGLEHYPSTLPGIGYGVSFLVEKTNQQFDILSYHYMPELLVSGTKTIGAFFARLSLGSGIDLGVERYDGEFDDPTVPDDIEAESVPDKTALGYTGSAGLALLPLCRAAHLGP